MELIDKQQAFVTLTEYYKHRTLIEHLMLSEALDIVPVVDAVPVSYIQQRIDRLRILAEYEAEANGGYTGQIHTEVYALRRLINYWKEERDANQDKTD